MLCYHQNTKPGIVTFGPTYIVSVIFQKKNQNYSTSVLERTDMESLYLTSIPKETDFYFSSKLKKNNSTRGTQLEGRGGEGAGERKGDQSAIVTRGRERQVWKRGGSGSGC